MTTVTGRLVLDDEVTPGTITIEDGVIASVESSGSGAPELTARTSPRASSTSTSTAAAGTTRWAVGPPSTGWLATCSATA